MRLWNNQAQWVTDEDGLRCYFSERDPGGLSRLECYRRLLAQPDDVKGCDYFPSGGFYTYTAAALRCWTDLVEVAKRTWRGRPVIQGEIAGHRLGSAG